MKLTKRQYEKQLVILQSKLQAAKNAVIDQENLVAMGKISYNDFNNDLYDNVWKAEKAIKDLEWEYDHRNYTAADWNTHNLIMQNID